MRPVRLELNGFAGFRVATVVDFTDADYFALVGSTGSGKSTILDALTFALYGTAYRWGRSNAISYALAPTSNRCTVSLTFDVASQRYQVAREVRRIGGQVQQKAVSLVRFADPTAGAVHPNGPQPEVLAGEIKELNAAVEQLLGLSFDDFCQCVVLPQGDFARFLSANTADRQRILLKLLGAAHYEGIGKRAGVQRDAAAKEVEVLTEQLGRYADATPEAEAEARARVSALELLATSVDALVPGVDEAHARAAEAAARAQALGGQADLLASISAPTASKSSSAPPTTRSAPSRRRARPRPKPAVPSQTPTRPAGPPRSAPPSSTPVTSTWKGRTSPRAASGCSRLRTAPTGNWRGTRSSCTSAQPQSTPPVRTWRRPAPASTAPTRRTTRSGAAGTGWPASVPRRGCPSWPIGWRSSPGRPTTRNGVSPKPATGTSGRPPRSPPTVMEAASPKPGGARPARRGHHGLRRGHQRTGRRHRGSRADGRRGIRCTVPPRRPYGRLGGGAYARWCRSAASGAPGRPRLPGLRADRHRRPAAAARPGARRCRGRCGRRDPRTP